MIHDMRDKLVLKFWDRSGLLNFKNKEYFNFVDNFFANKLKDDKTDDDITTNCLIDNKKNATARIIAKEDGIVAGIEEISLLFKNFKIKNKKNDGDKIKKNE